MYSCSPFTPSSVPVLTSQVIRLPELLAGGGTHGPLLLPALTQSLALILWLAVAPVDWTQMSYRRERCYCLNARMHTHSKSRQETRLCGRQMYYAYRHVHTRVHTSYSSHTNVYMLEQSFATSRIPPSKEANIFARLTKNTLKQRCSPMPFDRTARDWSRQRGREPAPCDWRGDESVTLIDSSLALPPRSPDHYIEAWVDFAAMSTFPSTAFLIAINN